MELKRKFYDNLTKWKLTSNGATSMLIEGARRVGKSYVAAMFAKRNYHWKSSLRGINSMFR